MNAYLRIRQAHFAEHLGVQIDSRAAAGYRLPTFSPAALSRTPSKHLRMFEPVTLTAAAGGELVLEVEDTADSQARRRRNLGMNADRHQDIHGARVTIATSLNPG